MLKSLIKELNQLANPEKAKNLARFFKTGQGEYGEGDIFLGITVPEQRALVKKYQNLNLNDCQKLLKSKIHEHRLVALLILVAKFKKFQKYSIYQSSLSSPRLRGGVPQSGTEGCINSTTPSPLRRATPPQRGGEVINKSAQNQYKIQQKIFNLYLKNAKYINNWDLVDLSAPNIVGNYLLDKDRKILYRLANSKNLWQRRIAILATFEFIKNNQFDDSIKIAKILLNDNHDLIHKAVGWMLREIGKRDQKLLENFLNQHAHQMPRTMLRYSIEKFPEKKRLYYLKI